MTSSAAAAAAAGDNDSPSGVGTANPAGYNENDSATTTTAATSKDKQLISSLVTAVSQARSISFFEEFVRILIGLSETCSLDDFRLMVSLLGSPMAGDGEIAPPESSSPEPSAAAPDQPTPGSSHLEPRKNLNLDVPTANATDSHGVPNYNSSLSHIAVLGLVKIFFTTLDSYVDRASLIFERLVEIALSREHPTDARLTALKPLFRIRCDSKGWLYVLPDHASLENGDVWLNIFTRNLRPHGICEKYGECQIKLVTTPHTPTSEETRDLAAPPAERDASSASSRSHTIMANGKASSNDSSVPSATASRNALNGLAESTPISPLWTYMTPQGLPEEPPTTPSRNALAFSPSAQCNVRTTIAKTLSGEPIVGIPIRTNPSNNGAEEEEEEEEEEKEEEEEEEEEDKKERDEKAEPENSTQDAPSHPSSGAGDNGDHPVVFRLDLWLDAIIILWKRGRNWDMISYVLAHLCGPLMNRHLFQYSAISQIQTLRSLLCEQIRNEKLYEPDDATGVRKSDVAKCTYEALTMLIGFHDYFSKAEQDELVRCFMLGIASWEGTSRGCIHALSVCCHEIPRSVAQCLIAILDRMARIITQSDIAVHILEFLATLARLPHVFVNFREAEIRPIFGICIRFIQTTRERRRLKKDQPNERQIAPLRPSTMKEGLPIDADLYKYVYSLAYNVMIFWFLSLKLQDRIHHVNWITKSLIFKDENGNSVIDEQSEVLVDAMQRSTFSDLNDTMPFENFPPSEADGPVNRKTWVVGMSIMTVETAATTGLSQVTKRQASGTTYSLWQQKTAPPVQHQARTDHYSRLLPAEGGSTSKPPAAIMPSHVLLQMTATALSQVPENVPLPLPDDDITNRALRTFDRIDIVDGYKVGVIYVGENQTREEEILANTKGSADYEYFLRGLGTKVCIREPKFNPQGLRAGTDGEYTYAWRDRTSEIIYHVSTMMPTDLENDPRCVNKKRHVGNDFVNVVYNRSNREFDFHTIASQFNFVNIIVTPVSRISEQEYEEEREWFSSSSSNTETASESESEEEKSKMEAELSSRFYVVKITTKPGFPSPSLSTATNPKVISAKSLSAFVRSIAFHAAFYSSVASSQDADHISSWHHRLREIRRLRNRALLIKRESEKEADGDTDASVAGQATAGGSGGRNTGMSIRVGGGGSGTADSSTLASSASTPAIPLTPTAYSFFV